MDDALRIHLEELEQLIGESNADGVLDERERAQIAELVERVRDDLAAAADDGGLNERMQESAVRLENEHPRVSELIRGVVDTLTGLGM